MRFKYFLRQLKWAKQRITRGFSDFDTFNLDQFYIQLFIDSLTYFKENLHGAPIKYFDEQAENPTWKWEKYLNEMIEHFRLANEDLYQYDLKEWDERNDLQQEHLNKGLEMLQKEFNSLWD
ncbi:hypothetical protein IJD44_00930 [bacterium]|nr:hypothetical protein [bacterium]